jgi:hypothetical protein
MPVEKDIRACFLLGGQAGIERLEGWKEFPYSFRVLIGDDLKEFEVIDRCHFLDVRTPLGQF